MIFPVMCVRSGGCAAFPDVCMTPGVAAGAPGPLPYMNLGMPDDGDGKSKVKTMNSNTLVKGSQLSKSTGNQAGSAPGGTVSGVMMGPVKVQSGCDKVKVEGEE